MPQNSGKNSTTGPIGRRVAARPGPAAGGAHRPAAGRGRAAGIRCSGARVAGRYVQLSCLVAAACTIFLAAPLAGCAARTDATGPAAEARHETRVERPGQTRTRRIEIDVRGGGLRGGEGPAGVHCPGEAGSTPAPATSAPVRPLAVHEVLAVLAVGAVQEARPETIREVLGEAGRLAERGLDVEVRIDEFDHTTPSADTAASALAESPSRLRTSSGEAALGFTTRLRRFSLPWGGKATGGAFGFEAQLLGGRGVNVLHVIGAAVMACALIPLLRTPRRWGAAAAFGLVGVGIVMTGTLVDRYPWVTLVAGVLALGLVAYGAYEAWRRGRLATALDAITPVVEHAPNGPGLKESIARRAARNLAAVKAETTASKARAGGDL
jgi:hypothetical protein